MANHGKSCFEGFDSQIDSACFSLVVRPHPLRLEQAQDPKTSLKNGAKDELETSQTS